MKRFAAAIIVLGTAAALLTSCSSATPAADTHHSTTPTARTTPSAAASIRPSRAVTPTPLSKTRASTPPTGVATAASTPADIQAAICAIVEPAGFTDDGLHCGVQNLHNSTADSAWYYGVIGGFDVQQQPATDLDVFIVNLTTHAVAGPSNIGFCQAGGPSKGLPVGGYTAVPTAVLTSFGLAPCAAVTQAPSPVSVPATSLPTQKPAPPSFNVDSFDGRWTGHVSSVVIAGATGTISYADLTKCPSCSFATAPVSTATFMLTRVQGVAGLGQITASSDPAVYAVGSPVDLTFGPGSPDHTLNVEVGSEVFAPLCDGADAGQCGA